jgi:hypothetical protein
MEVSVVTRDRESLLLRDLAVAQVHYATRRLRWLRLQARVRLSSVDGPDGARYKRCELQFDSGAGSTGVITSLARDWRAALQGATTRAARSIVGLWQRGRPQRLARTHAGWAAS